MDITSEPQKILSLCTGMRGLEIGVERAGIPIQPVCYLEIEAFVIENLVQQMEKGLLAEAPVFSDLTKFPFRKFRGKVHGIVGGYPCQPFSHAGLRAGQDDHRHLWPFIRRGVKESRPLWVFFENVEGHISLGLRDVLTDLRKLGYQVEVGLFSAAEVGAPHRRNRVFILGLENSFLLRMRGWGDEQRENWRRKIQTPRSGELADTGYGGYRHGAICEHPADESQERPEKFSSGSELGNAGCVIGRSEPERGMDLERNALAETGRNEGSNTPEASNGTLGDSEYPRSQGENSVRKSAIITKSGLLELSGLADADDNGKQQFERIFGEIRERAGHGSEESGAMDNSIGQGLAQREKQPARQECETAERSGSEDRGQSEGELRLRSQLGNNGEPVSDGEVSQMQGDQVGYGDFSGWPARPGEDQYSWEATRLESSVGYAVNGYNYREDLLRMAGNAVVPQQSEKAFRTLLLKFIK